MSSEGSIKTIKEVENSLHYWCQMKLAFDILNDSELYTYSWKLAHNWKANERHDKQNCSDRFLH